MKNKKLPSIVTLLVLTVITVFSWIALDVYRTLTTKPDPVVPAPILEPLNPTLDTEALENLKNRIHFEEGDIPEFTPIATVTPLPTAIPTPIPSSTPFATSEPTLTPTATPQ